MLEIRYRIVVPEGAASPFAPWFRHAPQGRLHGSNVRFTGNVGEAKLIVTTGGGDLDALVEDLLTAAPEATSGWTLLEKLPDAARFSLRWREPILPDCPSTLRVVSDALGPSLDLSYTLGPDFIVYRCLIPRTTPTDDLWPRLTASVERFGALHGFRPRLEVERFGLWAPAERIAGLDARELLLAAFGLGYYDSPPRATVRDIALATGVPGNIVLGHLRDAERTVLSTLGS